MIRELVRDEEILSTPCEPATEEDEHVAQDLLDTLATLEEAACLHANQIGVTKSIFVYLDKSDRPHVVYNAALKRGLRGSRVPETCLTRDEEVKVNRYDLVTITFEEMLNGKLVKRKREFQGWIAEIIQHMLDHNKGKLV